MIKKIAVVTGTRAEYGYLKPLIEKIKNNPNFSLMLYVTGMHLIKEYGNTIDEIKKDGFQIKSIVDMEMKENNSLSDLANSIGKGISEFSKIFEKDKPDLLVIFGDRVEPFAAAVSAIVMNIPIAHIHGGDKAFADLDNNLRYSLTKLSHIHFPPTEQSKNRILKLGEEEWRVYKVGSLSLDTILNKPLLKKEEMFKKYNIPNKKLMLIIYHPVTTEFKEASMQMRLILDLSNKIAEKEDMEIVIIYPNAYPGGFDIIQEIKRLMKENERIHVFENLPILEYISILANSSVFIGNSSSGIIEAPSLGIPYVCIGTRQQGRERGKNVIDVDFSESNITSAIDKALHDQEFLKEVQKKENPFGDGKASERIINFLKEIKLNKKLIQKKITY
jgi:UDP-hydrolysing UDP-N-acetyl-D-glucosamine 2-epimerase